MPPHLGYLALFYVRVCVCIHRWINTKIVPKKKGKKERQHCQFEADEHILLQDTFLCNFELHYSLHFLLYPERILYVLARIQ